jgi:hypothetical protein
MFRFYKRVNLRKNIGLNISLSGISASIRGKYGSFGTKGFSLKTGIPGLSLRRTYFKPTSIERIPPFLTEILILLIVYIIVLLSWNFINLISYIIVELVKLIVIIFLFIVEIGRKLFIKADIVETTIDDLTEKKHGK